MSLPAFYIPDTAEVGTVDGTVTLNGDGTATFRGEHYTIDIPTPALRGLRAAGMCIRPAIVLKKENQNG